MTHLGYLTWWSVGPVSLNRDEAQDLLDRHEIQASLPQLVIPVDAFRRIGSGTVQNYQFRDGYAQLRLHKAASKKTILVRDMVRSIFSDTGVPLEHQKVGDVVFYKPPRGRPSKARVRVTVQVPEPDVEEFAVRLRHEYDNALGGVDSQAVRRLVRAHLGAHHAIHVGGPYLLPSELAIEGLRGFVESLGGGSTIHAVPVIDDAEQRRFVGRAIEDAVRAGAGPDLIEKYLPLGAVPDTVWALLEELPDDRHERTRDPT